MKAKSELINILNHAIEMCAPDIHFILADTGIIVIQLRAGNVMIPYSRLSSVQYKQLLNYIETHAMFESCSKGYPRFGGKDGIMKFFEPEIILVCHASILITYNKFKSLCLRIKIPSISKCQKEIKKLAEIEATMILN